ncbi:MAG: amidohydrolase family protein [Chloroflexota bacterium]|nr:amidohydrolase family protein [Chloroflexota bacterium]
MDCVSGNPHLPSIIAEITSSPVFRRFLETIKNYGIGRICDCHAHISSGVADILDGISDELMPRYSFGIDDINLLYDELFQSEGIDSTTVIFDTPLPVYDLTKKNDQLLAQVKVMPGETSGRVVPFAIVTPDMPGDKIQEWVNHGARGFKMTPRTSSPFIRRGVISDVTLEEMLNPEALRIADSYGLPLVVHLPQLVVSPRMNPSLKEELVGIAEKYHNLKIILAHLGQAQTPAKMTDLLELLHTHDLWEQVWMDISAVTVPSVIAMALESPARLLFGTDVDFVLTERGKYIMFKPNGGNRVLAEDTDGGNVITALVSTNFGEQLKPFVAEQGIELDAPLMLFQFEGILSAIAMLENKSTSQEEMTLMLQNLFFRNAQKLLNI